VRKRSLSNFKPEQFEQRKFFWRVRTWSWTIVNRSIFSSLLCTSKVRSALLRFWGADIGLDLTIRAGVKIYFPWNLKIGDNCWIGEEVWFINHEKISIGSNVCISQRSIICSSGHNYRSESLEYDHEPIRISDGAWICLDAKVLPGVTIGECSVVSAGEIVRKSLPNYSILIGGHIHRIDPPR
jgi:putative colanic acid biosynthesis acetyltransferase WcaF